MLQEAYGKPLACSLLNSPWTNDHPSAGRKILLHLNVRVDFCISGQRTLPCGKLGSRSSQLCAKLISQWCLLTLNYYLSREKSVKVSNFHLNSWQKISLFPCVSIRIEPLPWRCAVPEERSPGVWVVSPVRSSHVQLEGQVSGVYNVSVMSPSEPTCTRNVVPGSHSSASIPYHSSLPLSSWPQGWCLFYFLTPAGHHAQLQPGLVLLPQEIKQLFGDVCTRIDELQLCREGPVQLSLLPPVFLLSRCLYAECFCFKMFLHASDGFNM